MQKPDLSSHHTQYAGEALVHRAPRYARLLVFVQPPVGVMGAHLPLQFVVYTKTKHQSFLGLPHATHRFCVQPLTFKLDSALLNLALKSAIMSSTLLTRSSRKFWEQKNISCCALEVNLRTRIQITMI